MHAKSVFYAIDSDKFGENKFLNIKLHKLGKKSICIYLSMKIYKSL